MKFKKTIILVLAPVAIMEVLFIGLRLIIPKETLISKETMNLISNSDIQVLFLFFVILIGFFRFIKKRFAKAGVFIKYLKIVVYVFYIVTCLQVTLWRVFKYSFDYELEKYNYPITSETISFPSWMEELELTSECEFKLTNNENDKPYRVYTYKDGSGSMFTKSQPEEAGPVHFVGGDYGVTFFNKGTKAIVRYGIIGEKHYVLVLNFSDCTFEELFKDLEYDESEFFFLFNGISEDGKRIIYSLQHYDLSPWSAGKKDFSDADAKKNGVWLYDVDSKQNHQLKHIAFNLENNTDWKVDVDWQQDTLIIISDYCPENECLIDVSSY